MLSLELLLSQLEILKALLQFVDLLRVFQLFAHAVNDGHGLARDDVNNGLLDDIPNSKEERRGAES